MYTLFLFKIIFIMYQEVKLICVLLVAPKLCAGNINEKARCISGKICDCYLVLTCAISPQLKSFAVLGAPSAALQGPQSSPLPSLNVKAFHHISFNTLHLLFHVFLFRSP